MLRGGTIHPISGPAIEGGSVLIAANQDSVFRRLTAVMGEPELADDPRYATHGARGANMTELDERIGRWSARFDADTLLSTLDAAGVPAGRIYRPRDMLADLPGEGDSRRPHRKLPEAIFQRSRRHM